MAVYQIDYDLRKQRNYQALYDRLKSYSAWCRPLESTWVIETTQTASQVRDYLKGAIDPDDGILVTRLSGEAAWANLRDGASRALKDLLERRAA
ncbi:hypothetical protein H0Z60_06300 [Ectothiorhodospiraceae bacterium WFHF3C12]|nr:hypothetical protein [Ectothiorhodospiraceae bacterium WFHF3C12]